MIDIPFNRATLTGDELRYVAEAIGHGHISGDGRFAKACQGILEEMLGAPKVILTTSCTHALEMCALLLDLAPGDEVIVPSFTFVSTANAFALRGARIVFCDVRPDTLNLDESLLPQLVTPRTRAVVVVHYAGVACEMDAIGALCGRSALRLVEDNAHGLGGAYRDRPLGSMGCLATQSFHETKNLTCGEGGALVVNDESYASRAEIIRDKGTDRSRFFRGEVDKYSWVALGSSYPPSEILAAFLLAQLENRQRIQDRRRELWTTYRDALSGWAAEQGIRMPVVPDTCAQAYHMFYLVLPDVRSRERFLAHLKEDGILAVFHYTPLHLSRMGQALGGRAGACPVTEWVSDRLVRLPFFNGLSEQDQSRVVETVRAFRV